MILGEKLKKFRNGKKLTQEQFADIVGVKRSAYAAYESGRVGVSTEMLQNLSKHFKVTIDELLNEINEVERGDRVSPNSASDSEASYHIAGKKTGLETLLEIINKQADTIKSQQETINKLVSDQGNANGRAVALG